MSKQNDRQSMTKLTMVLFLSLGLLAGCGHMDEEGEGEVEAQEQADDQAAWEAGEPATPSVTLAQQTLEREPPLSRVRRRLRKRINPFTFVGSPEGCEVDGFPRLRCPGIAALGGDLQPTAESHASASYQLDGRLARGFSPTISRGGRFRLQQARPISF